MKMKVKIFDESHEKDLEEDINEFLKEKDREIVNIQFNVSNAIYGEEQIYCFSALILYQEKKIQSPLKLYIFVILEEIYLHKHQS